MTDFSALPPPPPGLKVVEATRQNTLVLNAGEHFRIDRPSTSGGPDVWTWHLMNLGPGVLWMRWDGLGYADVNDAHSIQLSAGAGYEHIQTSMLTLAAQAQTTISFTATNIERGD